MLKLPLFWGRIPVPEIYAKVYCGPLFRPEKQGRIGGRDFLGACLGFRFLSNPRKWTVIHLGTCSGNRVHAQKRGLPRQAQHQPLSFQRRRALTFPGSAIGSWRPSALSWPRSWFGCLFTSCTQEAHYFHTAALFTQQRARASWEALKPQGL